MGCVARAQAAGQMLILRRYTGLTQRMTRVLGRPKQLWRLSKQIQTAYHRGRTYRGAARRVPFCRLANGALRLLIQASRVETWRRCSRGRAGVVHIGSLASRNRQWSRGRSTDRSAHVEDAPNVEGSSVTPRPVYPPPTALQRKDRGLLETCGRWLPDIKNLCRPTHGACLVDRF